MRNAASAAGQASRNVTRHTTSPTEAPLISANSSSAGSMARNAAVISRNASGDWCMPSTKTMPPRE